MILRPRRSGSRLESANLIRVAFDLRLADNATKLFLITPGRKQPLKAVDPGAVNEINERGRQSTIVPPTPTPRIATAARAF